MLRMRVSVLSGKVSMLRVRVSVLSGKVGMLRVRVSMPKCLIQTSMFMFLQLADGSILTLESSLMMTLMLINQK